MSWTLVTGGALRLGAEICRILSKDKHNILIHYRKSKVEAEKTAAECRSNGVEAAIIQGDFSSLFSTQAFIQRVKSEFPDIENLINNVGNFKRGSVSETSMVDWQALFQVNFHAPVAIMQALLPSINNFKGSIISLGTAGIGSMKAEAKYSAYTSSKASLLWVTKALAKEYAATGVRVNMVSPGQLDISVEPLDPAWKIQRMGTCKEVADVIAFLLKNENAYITGQNIEVAGGLSL